MMLQMLSNLFSISLTGSIKQFQKNIQRTSTQVCDGWMLDTLQKAKESVGISGAITLLENPFVDTPMLTFHGRTVLVIPKLEWRQEELSLIFCHELTHQKHKDLWIKWISAMLCVVHWFNPMIYLLTGRLNRWMELACDASVVQYMNDGQRRNYGKTILEVLSRVHDKQNGVCVALCEHKKDMKERLEAMIKVRTPSTKNKGISAFVLVLVCIAGLLMGAANYKPIEGTETDSDQERSSSETMITETTDAAISESEWGIVEEHQIVTDPLTSVVTGPTQFLWPVASDVRGISYENKEAHVGNGVDFAPGGPGADIYAAAAGVVVLANEGYTGYGHHILIDHGAGYQTLYAHCSSLDVKVGDEVKAGQVIAKVGRTGNATGNYLHFEVRLNSEYCNPLDYINAKNKPMKWPEA